ncbi:MAG: DUF4404 family protein [Deltaproteobacteria bacterium]|nr:DUF4404 family protein [Deltaproteobacteria bacterium]
MPPEALRSTLTKLHEELATAPTVDPASRALLEEVATDIRRVLDQKSAAPSEHAPRLELLAVQFEQDHPALAAAVRQVADALARVGF